MTVHIYEWQGEEYDEVATVSDGEIDGDEEVVLAPFPNGLPDDEFEIGEAFGGPILVATLTDIEASDLGNPKADDAVEALRQLEDAQKRLTWDDPGDVGQKADPFFDADESVPEFVKQAVVEALRAGAIQTISEDLPASVTTRDVEQFFEENLTQPQGWSLRSLTEDYAQRFGVDEDQALQAVRTQTSDLLNTARAQGYEELADDESRFKWVGPSDDRTTDACKHIKDRTNPDHGGDPVTLDELRSVVQEANQKHAPDYDGNEWTPHWQCRHTFVEHFD